ncbi:hypothetical protein [Mesorhizobium sp. BR115XR7A]|uniref:hypothetical protein n=1 Tax=Mesorhizobium sp. BR115XR7A TaxID=2876645 RepID=UPI001CCC20C9|nr:hypothetical protein [Mesorhizobium sp. BR115XR7A]MBZ9933117.1 hypothetical protein [Mesorhizobium sp. BR1-1-5]
MSEFDFEQQAWLKFDPVAIADILSDNRRAFFGLKETLLQGYNAWVIAPDNSRARRNSIALAVIQQMVRGESKVTADFPRVRMAVDLVARYEAIGIFFFEQIYYPIGGAKVFYRTSAKQANVRHLEKNRKAISNLLYAVRVLHFVAENVTAHGGRRPSLNGAIWVMEELRKSVTGNERLLQQRSLKSHWAKHASTIAIAYGAASLQYDDGRSLLDAIFAGMNFANQTDLIAEWIGRARFIAETVLSNLRDDSLGRKGVDELPRVLPRPFVAERFSHKEVQIIARQFQAELGAIT